MANHLINHNVPSATASNRRFNRSREVRRQFTALLFALPFLVFFGGFFIVPIVVGFHLALFIDNAFGNSFVWFRNFVTVFTDPQFYRGLLTVLLFGIIQVPVMVILALGIAFLLNSPFIKASKFFRFAVFLPYAVPGVVSALIWGYLYTPGLSPITALLQRLGLQSFSFLASGVVLFSIMNILTWQVTGYNSVIFHSSLQAQSLELDEAATIEGATWAQIVRRIKLPLLMPTVFLVLMFSVVGTLQLFNEPYIISSMTTIPYSYTPNMYIYNVAFSFGNFNYAAALSFVLALFTFGAAFGLMRYALPRGQGRS